jgi:hypothetical protein
MRVSSQLHALDLRLNSPKAILNTLEDEEISWSCQNRTPALRLVTKPTELSGLRTIVLVLKIMFKVVFVKFWRNFTIHDGFYGFLKSRSII